MNVLNSKASSTDTLQVWLSRLHNIFIPLAILVGAVAGILVVKFNQPVTILLTLAGLIVFAISIYSMEFGLLVLTFITYTRFSDVVVQYHDAPSVAKPFLVLLILSILLRWVIFLEPPRAWLIPAILLGIYGLAGFASIVYSPVPDRVWGGITDFIKDAVIAVVVVILLQSKLSFRRVLWTLILAGIFMGSISVFQYFTKTYDNEYGGFAVTGLHQIVGENDEYRVGGPLEDPNFFAQIMVVLIPISLERFFHAKRTRMRFLALTGAVLSLLCVLLSYSRGGFLALVVTMTVYFYFYPPKRTQLPVLIVALLVLIPLAPPRYFDRISTLTEFIRPKTTLRSNELSFQGRLSENLAAWEMIKSKPLFGVGLRSYNYLFPTYSKSLGLALVATEREAHNLYLEITAETGIIGLASFSLLIFVSIRTLLTARRKFLWENLQEYAQMTTGFMAGYIGYLVAATFIHGAYPRYLYFLVGVALSLKQLAQNEASKNANNA